jgi:succinate dehydrogenase/fumarate reductase flavoprotein subunit
MIQSWNVQVTEADVLVLGGGLAGYRAAEAACKAGASVALAYEGRGASPYIIGFNVPLGHEDGRDNPEIYFTDIVQGGCALNDLRLVRVLVNGAVPAFAELETIGVPFARTAETGGRFAQRHLSGNAYPRSVYHPDGVGKIMLERLIVHSGEIGVKVHAGWKAINLLRDGADVVGALLVKHDTGEFMAIHACATVLAMGGCGAIYADSTYPSDVKSDSYAFALDAGATLIDMEFVQFEPTVVVHPEGCKGMEMPTAMFGDGACLVNANVERFMFRYNPEHGEKRIDKATMALCIQREIDEGRGLPDRTVCFDTTQVSADRLESYVSHCKRLRAAGLEPTLAAPHVRPAAHSHMGGVLIDEQAFTGVQGLFAGGEAAGGVHGASRIAGNGATDAIVFGGIAGRSAARQRLHLEGRPWHSIHDEAYDAVRCALRGGTTMHPEEAKAAVRKIMLSSAGLYRSEDTLSRGEMDLDELQRRMDAGMTSTCMRDAVCALEATNMVRVCRIIVAAARKRRESRGAHQRTDFPAHDDALWLHHIGIRKKRDDGTMTLENVPIR